MFISRETAAPPPPPSSSLFLPHSEQNVLKQTSFFTPERTGRLIFALAIKIEEEAPAVSSGELSGRVLQAVPPSCRLTWLRPSAPQVMLPGCLCLAPDFPPAESRPGPAEPPGASFSLLPRGLLGPTRLTSASPPPPPAPMPHLPVLGPWADDTVQLSPAHLGLGCCPPGFTYI